MAAALPGQEPLARPLVRSVKTAMLWLPPVVLLGLAAALYCARLDSNGYANQYYSATALSMSQGWKNFIFGALDRGGFITVDKPPVAFWIQALSVKAFGLGSWSLLLPEAIAGVLSVGLLHELVRARYGGIAALIAGLTLAVTPITSATVRINMPDPVLVLVLLMAAWAGLRWIETGSLRLGLIAAALIGVAFNVKMLQAYLVVPSFALTFLLFAPNSIRVRILGLLGVSVVLLAVSASWPLAVDVVPKSDRPFVGGSTNNSERDLIFGYNGLGRITGDELSSSRAGGGASPRPGAPRPGGLGLNGLGQIFGGAPGWLRLFDDPMGTQIGWLVPFAAVGVLAAMVSYGTAPRVDRRRSSALFWTSWAFVCAVVFSKMQGVFHVYYTTLLAPALAALVGISAMEFVALLRRPRAWLWLLVIIAFGTTALLQVSLLRRTPDWNAWLTPTVIAGSASGAGLVVAARLVRLRSSVLAGRFATAAALLGLAAFLVAPAALSFTVLSGPGNSIDPLAGPVSQSGGPANLFRQGLAALGSQRPDPVLISYLEQHRDGAKYLVATFGTLTAAPIIVDTNQPVMALGGFLGSDPAPTLNEFKRYISTRQLRFVQGGGIGLFFGIGSGILEYIQQNCRAVSVTGSTPAAGARPLFDCWASSSVKSR